jgi:hypothetical protein
MHDLVKGLPGDGVGGLVGARGPGIVEENIDATEAMDGLVNGGADVVLVHHVAPDVAQGGAKLLDHAGALVVLDIGCHDASAFPYEEFRGCPPNP